MQDFGTFFERATGRRPHGYQARFARDGLPPLVRVPPGEGKTTLILAWLWRRLYGPDPAATPRRLIYALPPGALAEPVAREVRRWLANLGLADHVALHVAAGARAENSGDWRENMHRPAIVVGATDTLTSKALNRGFGTGRAIFPIDFALVVNGAQWILDEAQLCPQSAATLGQLARFAGERGTAEPFGLTIFSTQAPFEINEDERTAVLALRLGARRTIRRLRADPGDYRALARAVSDLHRPGTVTLVALGTVDAAQRVYRELPGGPPRRTLLHPRFRGVERAGRLADLTADPAAGPGGIVVSSQVAEAGLGLSAAVVVAEAAPWPSITLRAGRCNRAGEHENAEFWWLPPADPPPHQRQDVDAASAELSRLEGVAVTVEDLLARDVFVTRSRLAAIGGGDFARLFDTSADDVEGDLDIARYVRDGDDLDAEVAWATWTAGEEDGAPSPDVRWPAAEYRCRVSLGDVLRLAEDRAVWRFDRGVGAAGRWAPVSGSPPSRPRPGELLLVNAADGGYDPETGFGLSARAPVPDCPELLTPPELRMRGEPDERAAWQSLDEHSERVRDQAAALFGALAPDLPAETGRTVMVAGYLHDSGKARATWQDALCALAEDHERDEIAAGRPWAKSGKSGELLFAGGVSFRHELGSLLLADGPLRDLLAEAPDQDLARYLILAHHGLLRVQVRDAAGEPAAASAGDGAVDAILGLEQGATSDIPPMLGRPAATFTVDLGQFRSGGAHRWTETVLGLLDKYGPFVLAYLETVVRVADWRASAGRELPG